MRIRRDGQRFLQDRNAQDFLFQRDPHGAWLSMTRQALADNEYFVNECHADDVIPVTTARAALRLLIEFLERSK